MKQAPQQATREVAQRQAEPAQTGTAQLQDNRSAAAVQRRIATAANTAMQRKLDPAGAAVQRASVEEEEPLQAKPIQRLVPFPAAAAGVLAPTVSPVAGAVGGAGAAPAAPQVRGELMKAADVIGQEAQVVRGAAGKLG